MSGSIDVETRVRFSHSVLWRWMKNWYEDKGPAAWTGAKRQAAKNAGPVPQFVTSNAFIAHQYAKIVVHWMRDCFQFAPRGRVGQGLKQNSWKVELDSPLYIIEVGAGSGRFGFLFLTSLLELREFWPKSCLVYPFVYLMTDSCRSNVEAYKRNARLSRFIRMGILNFAVFDGESDMVIQLEVPSSIETGASGSKGSILGFSELSRNPIFMIGNYLFDTLRADSFRFTQGKLQEGLISVTVPCGRPDRLDPSQILTCRYKWDYRDVNASNYYTGCDKDLNFLLELYSSSSELSNATNLLIPVGGLRVLRNLHSLSDGRLAFLIGDKALLSMGQFQFKDPVITKHGSFSLVVNFHAVSVWVSSILEGVATAGFKQDSWEISAAGFSCLLGLCGGHSPRTTYSNTLFAHKSGMQTESPETFFHLKRVLENCFTAEGGKPIPLIEALSILRLSCYDVDILTLLVPRLMPVLKYPQSAPQLLLAFEKLLKGPLLARVYPNPGRKELNESVDVFFKIGSLLLQLKAYKDCLRPLNMSLKQYGETAGTLYNLGAAHYCLAIKEKCREGEKAELLRSHSYFEKSLKLSKSTEGIQARNWLKKIVAKLDGFNLKS